MPKSLNPAKPATTGLKCVLLVAHEDSTRLTAKWTLTDFGYQVDAARCAEEALALFNPALHDVVVTVDTMPGITGAELAHIIKLRSPRTPVVLLAKGPAPAECSCLDAVLPIGARVRGLTGTVQKLLER
jgi:CheY-like chemotaxis protein